MAYSQLLAKTNTVREISMTTVLADARRGHPGLFWFAVAMAVLAVVAGRCWPSSTTATLLGAPLWLKPLKFAISFAAYAGALAWMLGRLREPGAAAHRLGDGRRVGRRAW